MQEEAPRPREAAVADARQTMADFFMFFVGSTLLVLLVAVTIGMTSWALKGVLPTDKEDIAVVAQWVWNFLTAGAIVVVMSVSGLAMHLIRPAWGSQVASVLLGEAEKLKRLEQSFNGSADVLSTRVLPAFIGSETARVDTAGFGIIRALNDAISRIQLFGRDVFVYSPTAEHTERQFIVCPQLIEESNDIVRITGPMAGVVGRGSFDVATHIAELTHQKIENPKIRDNRPFREMRLAVPALVDPSRPLASSNVYPFFARRFAIELLTKIAKECDSRHKPNKKFRLDEIVIKIAFLDIPDLFPAIQIWDDQRMLVVPSIGLEDRMTHGESPRTSISEAVPFGIMIQRQFEISDAESQKLFDLSATIDRAKNYFDVALYGKESVKEAWGLNWSPGSSTFWVRNWDNERGGGPELRTWANEIAGSEFANKHVLPSPLYS